MSLSKTVFIIYETVTKFMEFNRLI